MKGVNVGGAFRWQDEAAIGYALTVNPINNIPFPDPSQPYFDDGFDFVLMISKALDSEPKVKERLQAICFPSF